jgi:fructose-1,6-bisphosphatase
VGADRIVFDALRSCGAVACASSEETTDVQTLGGSDYSVRLCWKSPCLSNTRGGCPVAQLNRGNMRTKYETVPSASSCQVAFDPLDGSSIVGANWAVSTARTMHWVAAALRAHAG